MEYAKKWLTPKYLLIYLVVAAVVYGLIYFLWIKGSYKSPYNLPKATWQASLTAQNNSGLNGTAVLAESGGKTTVTITLTGPAADVPLPAHIHVGSCPQPGAIKYPLNNVVNGKSETTIPVTIAALKGMLPLAVNVHKSAVEPQIYVSCGDLK